MNSLPLNTSNMPGMESSIFEALIAMESSIIEAPIKEKLTIIKYKDEPTSSIERFISSIVQERQGSEDPFYVLDLGVAAAFMGKWNRALPNIHPYFAVKCNPNPALLSTMAALGSNFDCASLAEIELVLSLGVSPDRIIYANPCKAESHIRYAARFGVNLATFDSVYELEKMKKWHPKCELLIRIKAPDDVGAKFQLGAKYGALPEEVKPLLQAAQAAQLTVTGVSFHVGSIATRSCTYRSAIEAARAVFDSAESLGMPPMTVLNIGGGFTTSGSLFEEVAATIKAAIEDYFSEIMPGLRIISEPGRFFTQNAATLVTSIIGKRIREGIREYWINDGTYGSFNHIIEVFPENVSAMSLKLCNLSTNSTMCDGVEKKITYESVVFGPTCDSWDTVIRGYQFPELQIGDLLVFRNMGAYAAAAACNFNGFNSANIKTYLAFSKSF